MLMSLVCGTSFYLGTHLSFVLFCFFLFSFFSFSLGDANRKDSNEYLICYLCLINLHESGVESVDYPVTPMHRIIASLACTVCLTSDQTSRGWGRWIA